MVQSLLDLKVPKDIDRFGWLYRCDVPDLSLQAKLDTILRDAFNSSEIFVHALKEAFEHFINSRENRPAELIAKFVDAKLKVFSQPHGRLGPWC